MIGRLVGVWFLPSVAAAMWCLAPPTAVGQITVPGLERIREAWEWSLEDTEAEFEELVEAGGIAAARRERLGLPPADGPVDPFELPKILSEEGEGGRPMLIASTQKRYRRREAGVWREEIDAYAANRPLTDDERGLLYAFADARLLEPSDWQQRFRKHAAAVREAGTDDPVMRAYLARVTERSGPSKAGLTADVTALAETVDAAIAAEAPPLFRARLSFYALRAAMNLARSKGEAAPTDGPLAVSTRVTVAAEQLQALSKSITPEAAAARPQLPRIALDAALDVFHLFNPRDPAEGAYRFEILEALSDAAVRGGDAYAFHVMMAEFHVKSAWDARGSGFASTVTEDGWELFGERLEAAAAHGHAAWLLHPNLPEAPTKMITIAMGRGDLFSTPEWFAEAMAAQVENPDAWGATSHSLMPKWGGDSAAMLRLAKASLRPDLREVETHWHGFQVLDNVRVGERFGDGPPLPGPWRDALAEFAEHYVRFPPTEKQMRGSPPNDGWAFHLGLLAHSLLEEQMEEEALPVLRLWPRPDKEPMQLRNMLGGLRRDYVAGPIAAAQGAAAADAAVLAAALAEQAPAIAVADLPRLRAAAAAVRSAADGDPIQLGWLEDVDVVLGRVEGIASGERTPLTFREGLPGWRCQTMRYALEKRLPGPGGEHAVLKLYGETTRTTPFVTPIGRLPEPFYLSADFETVPIAGKPGSMIGVAVGPGSAPLKLKLGESMPEETTGGFAFLWDDHAPGGKNRVGWATLPWRNPAGWDGFPAMKTIPGDLRTGRLGLLAEGGRLAAFFDRRLLYEDSSNAPPDVQPVRLGTIGTFFGPSRLRIGPLGVAHRPDFTVSPAENLEDLPLYLLTGGDGSRPEGEDQSAADARDD